MEMLANKYLLSLLPLLLVLNSCGSSEMKASELIPWVEATDNGLHLVQAVNNYEFEAQLKPIDYIIAMEARKDEISEPEYQQAKKELEGLSYIDLKIGGLNKQENALTTDMMSEEDYFIRLDYYLTYARNDIFLVEDQDTLRPTLYHFERNYGISPKNTMLLGFETKSKHNDLTLVMDDQILGVGRIKFNFEQSSIESTPKLKRI